ncbi:MAG TPA: hypothetical protein VIP56_04100 [Nitrososphaeraceae archaeon]
MTKTITDDYQTLESILISRILSTGLELSVPVTLSVLKMGSYYNNIDTKL